MKLFAFLENEEHIFLRSVDAYAFFLGHFFMPSPTSWLASEEPKNVLLFLTAGNFLFFWEAILRPTSSL